MAAWSGNRSDRKIQKYPYCEEYDPDPQPGSLRQLTSCLGFERLAAREDEEHYAHAQEDRCYQSRSGHVGIAAPFLFSRVTFACNSLLKP